MGWAAAILGTVTMWSTFADTTPEWHALFAEHVLGVVIGTVLILAGLAYEGRR